MSDGWDNKFDTGDHVIIVNTRSELHGEKAIIQSSFVSIKNLGWNYEVFLDRMVPGRYGRHFTIMESHLMLDPVYAKFKVLEKLYAEI